MTLEIVHTHTPLNANYLSKFLKNSFLTVIRQFLNCCFRDICMCPIYLYPRSTSGTEIAVIKVYEVQQPTSITYVQPPQASRLHLMLAHENH